MGIVLKETRGSIIEIEIEDETTWDLGRVGKDDVRRAIDVLEPIMFTQDSEGIVSVRWERAAETAVAALELLAQKAAVETVRIGEQEHDDAASDYRRQTAALVKFLKSLL